MEELSNEEKQWVEDTFGNLVWSFAIDDGPYNLYEPSTQMFLTFVEAKFLELKNKPEEDIQNKLVQSLRMLAFVFQKELGTELRELYPNATSWSTSLGAV